MKTETVVMATIGLLSLIATGIGTQHSHILTSMDQRLGRIESLLMRDSIGGR